MEVTVTLGNVEVTKAQLEEKLKELKEKESKSKYILKPGLWFKLKSISGHRPYEHSNLHYVISHVAREHQYRVLVFPKGDYSLPREITWDDGLDDSYVVPSPIKWE